MTTRPRWAFLGLVVGTVFFFTARLYLGTGWLWFALAFPAWIWFGLLGLTVQLAKDGKLP